MLSQCDIATKKSKETNGTEYKHKTLYDIAGHRESQQHQTTLSRVQTGAMKKKNSGDSQLRV